MAKTAERPKKKPTKRVTMDSPAEIEPRYKPVTTPIERQKKKK